MVNFKKLLSNVDLLAILMILHPRAFLANQIRSTISFNYNLNAAINALYNHQSNIEHHHRYYKGWAAGSGLTETLGAPRNLVRWGPYVGISLCRDFLLVGGP